MEIAYQVEMLFKVFFFFLIHYTEPMSHIVYSSLTP